MLSLKLSPLPTNYYLEPNERLYSMGIIGVNLLQHIEVEQHNFLQAGRVESIDGKPVKWELH